MYKKRLAMILCIIGMIIGCVLMTSAILPLWVGILVTVCFWIISALIKYVWSD